MYYMRFLTCLTLAVLASYVNGKESVPVLIWDTQQSQRSLPAVSALQVVSLASLEDKYLNAFQPKNILLFLQDTLSVEDLSSHADELNYIRKQMEASHSLYLPAVEEAESLVHVLSNHGYKVTVVEAGSNLGGLTLDVEEKNLVVVKLPSTVTNPSRKNALRKSDEVLGNVISKIGKIVPFTVIFTGKKPSVDQSIVPHYRPFRSLKNRRDTKNDTNLHRSQCVMLYLRDKIVVNKNGEFAYDLPSSLVTSDFGDCSIENRAIIMVNYKDVDSFSKVKITVVFEKIRGNSYALATAEIYEYGTVETTTKLYPKKKMYAVPIRKAYTCGIKHRLYSNDTGTSIKYEMVLPSLQVQAFIDTANQESFGPSWDCVGFFTIPIWTGIITGIMLTFILMVGLAMVANVKTMDRFDDPKGKHFMMVPSGTD